MLLLWKSKAWDRRASFFTDDVISWVLQSSLFYQSPPPEGAQNVLISLQDSWHLLTTLIEKTFTASVTCCAVQVRVFLKLFSSLPDEILILLFFTFLQRERAGFLICFFTESLSFTSVLQLILCPGMCACSIPTYDTMNRFPRASAPPRHIDWWQRNGSCYGSWKVLET